MDTSASELEAEPLVYDTEDRSCGGELLREIEAWAAPLEPGQLILVVSADPAAPLDLRAWTGRSGYAFLGPREVGGRPAYAIRKGG